ncbi:hypothetical protein [Arthrobacter rhombi]|uniref:hypothetical protein n=1 Tax=Arthrobacter rhombi TaxID=71253 RepID=UPI001178778B|nr:hypothetical protein [Arthrobacter rhombi]
MNEKQIQDIADRVIEALNNMAPTEPSAWAELAAITPLVALTAAFVAAVIGYRNLKQQRAALEAQISSHESNLTQKSEADSRSEWWRRTQWALEAAASENTAMYGYGAGMLDLLARSELAGPHDKELLYTVFKATSTEMEDEGIEQLIEGARRQKDLTTEEIKSLLSYDQATIESLEKLKKQSQKLTYDVLAGLLESSASKGTQGRAVPKIPRNDEVFDTIRREILAARLKVTLDQELERKTSPTVKRLSQMKLTPLVAPTARSYKASGHEDFRDINRRFDDDRMSGPPPME